MLLPIFSQLKLRANVSISNKCTYVFKLYAIQLLPFGNNLALLCQYPVAPRRELDCAVCGQHHRATALELGEHEYV